MNTTNTETSSTSEQAVSALTHALAQNARNYFEGYGRHNLAGLQQLARFDGWQRLAQQEIERRAYSLLQAFGPELLQAIAQGSLRIGEIAGEVAEEIARQAK